MKDNESNDGYNCLMWLGYANILFLVFCCLLMIAGCHHDDVEDVVTNSDAKVGEEGIRTAEYFEVTGRVSMSKKLNEWLEENSDKEIESVVVLDRGGETGSPQVFVIISKKILSAE